MKDFLEEIGNFVMPHIEIESIGILLMSVALIYILFRYQSKFLKKCLRDWLSLVDENRASAEQISDQFPKSGTVQEEFSPKNIRYTQITDFLGSILIADDDKNMCEILTDIIEGQFKGFSIETANDGEEALQHINRLSPSLLILDLQMPKKTGFEVLKELSTRSERFPILVISSDPRSMEEIEQQAQISIDRFEYLQKTFNNKEFIDMIQRMLSR